MSTRWIVTALGKDRPGIVAGITKILYQLGCNLEDSAMTRLGGEFAVMLAFSSSANAGPERLRRAFEPLERRLRLAVHLTSLTASEAHAPRTRGRPYQISVYGADRAGIVYRVTEALAKRKINIMDVHAHRSASKGPSLYLLMLEVEMPAGRSAASIESQLKRVAKQLGVQLSLRPAEADVL